jgi:cytoskeleton protein RodZ
MTESTEAMPEAQAAPRVEDAPAAPLPSYGRMLAAERERQGISIVDMAARLRLHPKQIAAIEAEDLDRLPGGPFVRGFVRNYAKELRIDPAPLLDALRERLAPAETGAESAAAGPSQVVRDATRERVSRSVVIIGAVGALIAFGVIGWLSTRSAPPAVDRKQAAMPPAPVAPVTPVANDSPSVSAASLPAQISAPDAAAPGGATESAAPIAAAPAPASLIRLAFRERAWVEVTQADGRVLLSQNNDAGSEQKLDGKPPFKLVIGNASAVTLEYRGRAIDLKPLTSIENVARVTLE